MTDAFDFIEVYPEDSIASCVRRIRYFDACGQDILERYAAELHLSRR